jgi:hypothetical protein
LPKAAPRRREGRDAEAREPETDFDRAPGEILGIERE